jgi:hypothetical protein
VRNGKDRNMRSESDEDNAVWKVVNWQRSHLRIVNTWDQGSSRRKLLKMLKCVTHFLRKTNAYFGAAFTVPSGSFAQLTPCSRPQTNSIQRDSTSR